MRTGELHDELARLVGGLPPRRSGLSCHDVVALVDDYLDPLVRCRPSRRRRSFAACPQGASFLRNARRLLAGLAGLSPRHSLVARLQLERLREAVGMLGR